jgi:Caspase domain
MTAAPVPPTSRRVFALLVGIDAYLPPISPLWGCRNDVAAVEQYLQARVGTGLELRTLYDSDATRDALVAAFREHLSRAGRGDVALFVYAGHGSEEPAPAEVAQLEPTGRIQTLLLHDCGRRVDGKLRRAFADKELAVLLAEVVERGPHVAVVLDCCHSGGGTRDPFVGIRGWVPDPMEARDEHARDLLLELGAARPPSEFIPGALDRWVAPNAPHVALAACRSYETAKELRVGDDTRGAFSVALVEALAALGTRTTYRTLLTTVRSRVERTAFEQRPQLEPVENGGLGDALFLDGSVTPVASTFTMSQSRDGWEVDGGLVHGLRPPVGDEAFVLACTGPDGEMAGAARVTAVEIGRASVEPIGWQPADVAYAAVVADVPLPAAAVQVDPPSGDVEPDMVDAVERALRAAVATAGPGGAPSPHVRLVEPSEVTADGTLRLRVSVPEPGVARIARADGSPVTADTDVTSEGGATLLVCRLEHVARWEQVRGLGGHPSPLGGAVTLGVYEARAGETRRPADRDPVAAGGGFQFAYRREGDSWVPPRVFIDLQNTSPDDLHVCVLDLTDRFRCHVVFPTDCLVAGHAVDLWGGAPIPLTLPDDRVLAPGAIARDWLKIVVSDVDFDAAAFDLPPLDEPPPVRDVTRSATWGTLTRIAARAVTRDVGASGPPKEAARWAADTIAFEITVPS